MCISFSYLDPAYLRNGRISPKFDTYALGLIIVQLCCQMPSVQEVHGVMEIRDRKYTVEDTARLFAGKLAVTDNSFMEAIGNVLLCLGLECCEREPRHRPELKEVLNRIMELQSQVCNCYLVDADVGVFVVPLMFFGLST